VHWCARADTLLDVAGLQVLDVASEADRFVIKAATDSRRGGLGEVRSTHD
jgi:hypothetical protein